jgi:hypothetical protein
MNFKFDGTIVGGLPVLQEQQAFLKYLKGLEGQEVTITVKKKRKMKDDRSNRQNRYYWSVVVQTLADELGYTPEEMHEAIKYEFLARDIDLKGLPSVTMASTATLNTKEFEDLMSKIRQWASINLSIYIPAPNEAALEY